MRLSRRTFLRVLGAATAVRFLPSCGDNALAGTPRFFTTHEWETIDAVTGVILPPGKAGIGARRAVAVRYIDRLLAAFDETPPAIFAGGPFSDRNPIPDAQTGQPTGRVPANDMATFLPLARVREIAWRVRIFGSAATAGGDFNDAVLGPTVGWRDLYRQAVVMLDAVQAGTAFVDLAPIDQTTALATVSSALPAWGDAILEHTLEGTFAAPEYGGNDQLAGWQLARYDGDSAPLGHALFDPQAMTYRDRTDEPTSVASPGDTDEPFDEDILNVLTVAAIGSGGMRFF